MRRPCLFLLSALLVVAGPGGTSPARASTISDVEMYGGSNANNSNAEPCTTVADPESSINTQLVANGPAVTMTYSPSGTLTRNSMFADTMHYDLAVTATGRLLTRNGQPSALTLRGRGSAEVVADVSPSACRLYADALVGTQFDLTITAPLILEATVRTSGDRGDGSFSLNGTEQYGLEFGVHGGAGLSSSTGRVLLPAGTYTGFAEILTAYVGSTSATLRSAVDIEAVFHRPGVRLTKAKGPGKKYTVLPAARSCPSGKTKVKITSNKGRSVQIDRVDYFVDGKRVKKTGNTGPGSSVRLKGAKDADVEVRALTTLKNGKVLEARADYLACTL